MDDDHKFTGPSADDPLDTRPDDGIDALGISAAETETPEVFRVGRPGGRRAFLQTLSKSAAVGTAAVVTDNCSSPSTPTPASTTTSSSTTTVRTTTTVAPTFTLAGVVKDKNGTPVVGARVFVVDGANANKASTTDGNGYYSIPALVASSFTLRTTYNGIFLYDQPVTITRDTRLDFAVPTVPTTTSTTSISGGGGGGGGGGGHYWYPN